MKTHASMYVALAMCLVGVAAARAQSPELVNYQGRLVDGSNLVNGTVSIVLGLYDQKAGGSPDYVCSNDVTVVDGLYTMQLGTNTVLGSLTNALSDGTAYLQITADGTILTPRERLISAPYALHAQNAQRANVAGQVVQLTQLSNVVWVARNGTASGPGTIDKPFDTPQNGYNAAAARFTNGWGSVAIVGGVYTGGLNMGAGNIHVIGVSRPVIAALSVAGKPSMMTGKQRVEGIAVQGPVTVLGDRTKFRNCRMEMGATIGDGSGAGSNVEFQDCRLQSADEGMPLAALYVFPSVTNCGVYQSSLESLVPGAQDPQPGRTATLEISPGVAGMEVIGCEIVNSAREDAIGGLYRGPAIKDWESGQVTNQHFFAYNYIKGPPSYEQQGAPSPFPRAAVIDSATALGGPTIAFHHNTVWGDVGVNSNKQFYANNVVHGLINGRPTGFGWTVGWTQAGTGTGQDAAGNTEHEIVVPTLPDSWDD